MAEAAKKAKERNLATLQARQETLFNRVQILFDLSKEVDDASKLLSFKVRFEKLEETKQDFERIISEINLVKLELNSEHIPNEQSLIAFDELYYAVQVVAVRITSPPGTADRRVDTQSSPHGRARLPKIELIKFDGTLSHWPTFYDMFRSLVHNDETIDPVQKFHYLISTLTGAPLSLVKGLPVTENNYAIVWDLLVEEYQNERNLANSILDKLFSIRPQNSESASSLSLYFQTYHENIKALQNLNIDIADYLLVYIGLRNLEPSTKRQFEIQCDKRQIPTVDQLTKFLKDYVSVLQRSQVDSQRMKPQVKGSAVSNISTPKQRALISTSDNSVPSCLFCHENHRLLNCQQFLSLAPPQRRDKCKEFRLCFNCLASSHMADKCSSKFTCRRCNGRHHTLLHVDNRNSGAVVTPALNDAASNTNLNRGVSKVASGLEPIGGNLPQQSLSCSAQSPNLTTVLLGTALARIQDSAGCYHPLRIVIDCGSQLSFITSNVVERLGLSRRKCFTHVSGIGSLEGPRGKGITTCVIAPTSATHPQLSTEAVILPNISANLPSVPLSSELRDSLSHISLADPQFDKSGPIDMLLGADLYPFILVNGQVKITPGEPTAMKTIFGWIIMGRAKVSNTPAQTMSLLSYSNSLENIVRRFWEVEETSIPPLKNPEDVLAESHFVRTHYRSNSGRFVVSLPFREEEPLFRGNFNQAVLARLQSVERRLSKQFGIQRDYIHFMQEYIHLGHMQLATKPGTYLIPHHCVLTPANTSTKLRVVFDASFSIAPHDSLNQQLYVGPKLQLDISDIVTKFRQYPVALTADICKMYRQILLHPDHRKYQHILWRSSPNEPVKEYELNTVTYGISSAPFLAIRVLHQLAKDEGARFPQAAQVLQSETYVDNIVSGANTIEEALELQTQLKQILQAGGFTLRKWASNSAQVLEQVPEIDRESLLSLDDSENPAMKILGLQWDPSSDSFRYCVTEIPTVFTKRAVLSTTARIFDPLGWAAPVVFWSKRFFQDLWLEGLQWDDPLPTHLRANWERFVTQLPLLRRLQIPRFMKGSSQNQIIGFCDASERGFSAVTYLRTTDPLGIIDVFLIKAKTKVAPIKTLTIPKLELCGAVLLARLLKSLHLFIKSMAITEEILFTDSSIVRAWLHTPPHRLKVYVANRVTEIHETTSAANWHHIPSEQNPADCASRGIHVSELHNHPLWWKGPPFLRTPNDQWTFKQDFLPLDDELPEMKSTQFALVTTTPSRSFIDCIERFSSLLSLQRVIAYILRFVHNTRQVKSERTTGPITATEMNTALRCCIKLTQQYYFTTELQQLSKSSPVSSSLNRLAPFLDLEGLCRVGGRIRHSILPYDQKHPILLPKKSHLSGLIVDYLHKSYLHVGPRTLQSLLGRRYWIPGARSFIRSRIFRCLPCYKLRAKPVPPKMGDLPDARVIPSRPFLRCGIDFGGPIIIRESLRRKAQTSKAYFCLFCCMATKAVHLEVVSHLSTEAFLAALQRFVSRRGLCAELFSDNGTNFVGAARHLREVQTFLNSSDNQDTLSSLLAPDGITWHFNPPSAPHFGGLWEAGIKSTKHHLYRLVKEQPLTYEEFTTILIRIEGILNSRPLCPLSTDPHENDPLTPGHFLIGSPLLQVPEEDLTETPTNRLTRWKMTQKITQHFWKRWSHEYLTTLQDRSKWAVPKQSFEPGDLALIYDERCPPGQWLMGRITEVHPGKDNIVRVATVNTKKGPLRRPVHKLVAFPPPQ